VGVSILPIAIQKPKRILSYFVESLFIPFLYFAPPPPYKNFLLDIFNKPTKTQKFLKKCKTKLRVIQYQTQLTSNPMPLDSLSPLTYNTKTKLTPKH
jgi:hypothetical protein